MKTRNLFLAVLIGLGLNSAWATNDGNNNTNNSSSVRYVKAPRFARPLVEKWIAEYAKTEPGVDFQIAKGSQDKDEIDLNVVFDNQETNTTAKDFSQIVYFGEFAVLPITAAGSEAAQVLEGKHLNSKKLKQLFFLNDDFEEDVKKNKQFERLVVYSGSNAASVATSFAHNFGEEQSSFRGKRISGDDLFLNTALGKDPLGVSFNALPNIFDLQSRHVRDGLAIVGLDLKKDWEENFSTKGSLDDILDILESGHIQEVPIAKLGLTYKNEDNAVTHFLDWVLTNGTKFNHTYGLLNLDQKLALEQQQKVKNTLTAQNH